MNWCVATILARDFLLSSKSSYEIGSALRTYSRQHLRQKHSAIFTRQKGNMTSAMTRGMNDLQTAQSEQLLTIDGYMGDHNLWNRKILREHPKESLVQPPGVCGHSKNGTPIASASADLACTTVRP